MKFIKTYWKPVILSWMIFIPLTALLFINREWTWYSNIVLGVFYFFIVTLKFNRKDLPRDQRVTNTLLIISPLLPMISFYLWKGPNSYMTAPLYIFNPIIGIVFGFIYLLLQKVYLKIAIVLLLIVFCGWATSKAIHVWLDYYTYGTWSGLTDEEIIDFCLTSKDSKVCKADLKNKIVVLDFWNTSCGKCYAAFPEFSKQIKKWSRDSDIEFYTVNVPIKTDSLGQADNVLKTKGYSFKNLIAYNPDSTYKVFKVIAYPTTIVLDKEGKIVFRGNPSQLEKILESMK